MKNRGALIICISVFVLLVYFILFLLPIDQRITSLKSEIILRQKAVEAGSGQKGLELELDRTILELQDEIRHLAKSYYADLEQEDALEIVNRLNVDDRIHFDIVEVRETTDSKGARNISVRLSFHASYQDAIDFVDAIRHYEKRIDILSASMELSKYQSYEDASNEDASNSQEVIVNLMLNYIVIPSDDNAGSDAMGHSNTSGRGAINLFSVVEFVRPPLDSAQSDSSSTDGSQNNAGSDAVTDASLPVENPGDYLQYDFEDGGYAFQSDANATGDYSVSDVSKSGMHSAELQCVFGGDADGEASLVLMPSQKIEGSPVSMSVYVYAHDFSDQVIGFRVRTHSGVLDRVVLASSIDWIGWKMLRAELPENSDSLDSFFVEGSKESSGRYLFDRLVLHYQVK